MFFCGLPLATVKSFENSVYFPNGNIARQRIGKEREDFSSRLRNRFKDWASENSKNDKTFRFLSEFVLEFGPLLLIYQSAIQNGQFMSRFVVSMTDQYYFPMQMTLFTISNML